MVKLLFVEFNKVVKAQGSGFVDYLWQNRGRTHRHPSCRFVRVSTFGLGHWYRHLYR